MADIQKLIACIQVGTATDEDIALACGYVYKYTFMDGTRGYVRNGKVKDNTQLRFLTGPEWDLSAIVAELPEGWTINEVVNFNTVVEPDWLVKINNLFGDKVKGYGPTPKAAAAIAMLRARMETY